MRVFRYSKRTAMGGAPVITVQQRVRGSQCGAVCQLQRSHVWVIIFSGHGHLQLRCLLWRQKCLKAAAAACARAHAC
jgi:hypothetical protein